MSITDIYLIKNEILKFILIGKNYNKCLLTDSIGVHNNTMVKHASHITHTHTHTYIYIYIYIQSC